MENNEQQKETILVHPEYPTEPKVGDFFTDPNTGDEKAFNGEGWIDKEVYLQSIVEDKVSKKTEKEIIEEYIEQNRDNIVKVASELNIRFSGNWFGVEQMMKKTNYKDPKQCYEILSLLKLAGYMMARKNPKRGREEYKIILNLEHKRQAIENEIELLLREVQELRESLERVNQQIVKQHKLDVEQISKSE